MPVNGINPATTYIGPVIAPVMKRGQYPLRRSETISSEDRIFKDEVKAATPEETVKLKNPVEVVIAYRPMIEDHIERRVAIFFQQLVVAYGTGLFFEIGKTADQGESVKALHIIDHNGKKGKLCVRNAAHSSTIPCLIAYDGKAWKKHIDEGADKPEGFVYIKGSDIYRGANSTLAMPRDINEADIQIDGKADENALRDQSLSFLNEAAKGAIDPVSGIKKFIETAKKITTDKIKSAKKPGVKKALTLFKEFFERIEQNLLADDEIFDQMLGVRIDEDNDSARTRRKVYELRYKAILDCQLIQSELVQKVSAVSKAVLQKVAPLRAPAYFEDAFRHVVKQQLSGASYKMGFDKLFNNPGASYFRDVASRRTLFDKAVKLVEQELPVVKVLAGDLQGEFRHLKLQEIRSRGRVTSSLRLTMNWSQRDLSRKIQTLFPLAPGSQSTVSRVENNIKLVDPNYAKQLAQVFKVDPALFMPSFFYS